MQVTENFSDRVKEIFLNTERLVREKAHMYIEPSHLALSIFVHPSKNIEFLSQDINFNMSSCVKKIESLLVKIPKITTDFLEVKINIDTQKLINHSLNLAKRNGDEFLTEEFLFLGIVDLEYPVSDILRSEGVNYTNLSEAIKKLRKGKKAMNTSAESMFNSLEKFAIDITAKAANGKLDPVIGRDEEIRRTIQVISRRTKNNPVLIGEPGVGKTAIVEGLANRIVDEDVPETIKGKKIFSLDLASLIAGSKFRGEFEERLKSVLNEVSEQSDQII